MVRFGKKQWNDEFDDMKSHRYDRKFRWHKLSVALGHNRRQRREGADATRRSQRRAG